MKSLYSSLYIYDLLPNCLPCPYETKVENWQHKKKLKTTTAIQEIKLNKIYYHWITTKNQNMPIVMVSETKSHVQCTFQITVNHCTRLSTFFYPSMFPNNLSHHPSWNKNLMDNSEQIAGSQSTTMQPP